MRRGVIRLSASLANVPPTNVHTATPAANDADQGRARSSVYSAASVAGHDTPLIAERAARAATEGGDERTGARRDQFQRQFANARGERRDQGARSSRADRRMWDGMRAGGDAPLIDERAATQRKATMSGLKRSTTETPAADYATRDGKYVGLMPNYRHRRFRPAFHRTL